MRAALKLEDPHGGNKGTKGVKKQLRMEECPHAAIFLLLGTGWGALILMNDEARGSPKRKDSADCNTDKYPYLSHTDQSAVLPLKDKTNLTEEDKAFYWTSGDGNNHHHLPTFPDSKKECWFSNVTGSSHRTSSISISI